MAHGPRLGDDAPRAPRRAQLHEHSGERDLRPWHIRQHVPAVSRRGRARGYH